MREDFRVELDSGEVLARLNALLGATGDLSAPLDEIGTRLKSRVQLGFRHSTDPYGNPWAPIYHRSGKPLVDTKVLRDSITYEVSPSGDALEVGTNIDYAEVHQFGYEAGDTETPITARPFLPIGDSGVDLPEAWEADVLTVINTHLNDALGGGP